MSENNNETLKYYYNEIRKYKVFNSKEQIELIKKYRQGDKKAFDTLIKSNLRFVVSIAKEYDNKHFDIQDLINEGNIGLMKAIDKFDPDKNIKFISYAVWWIRQSIMKFMCDNKNTVRRPLNIINEKNKISSERKSFFQKHKREPTNSELSERLGVSQESIKINSNSDNSLNTHLDNNVTDESDNSFSDLIKSDDLEKMQNKVNKSFLKRELTSVMSSLTETEKQIISHYFGINDSGELTLKEIGKKVGLSNERVRQIKETALKKMRSFENSIKLKEFL